MKGWELPAPGVRDGGFLIFSAPCWEGVGAKFYARLIDEYPDVTKWQALESKPYTLGLHKLVRTARAKRRFRLMAVTGMPVEQVRRFGYEAFDTHEAALSAALAQLGRPCRMLVVEDSALTTIVRQNRRILAPSGGAEGVNV
jgi:nickel-dependent lactate racemase